MAILIANAGASFGINIGQELGKILHIIKKDYFEIGGFDPVKNKISGDDMYLVQSISNIKRGYIHIDPNSFVKTKAMSTIKDFINQRIRWFQILNQTLKISLCFLRFY